VTVVSERRNLFAEGIEPAGALVVIFEEVRMDVEAGKSVVPMTSYPPDTAPAVERLPR
jgi:hypothetical protein